MNSKDLENRLIEFAVNIINLVKSNEDSYAGKHLSGQIIRSSTSVPLNYGEAQSAESRKDFIHKMQISLKELRETYVNIRIIKKAKLNKNIDKLDKLISENNELISIFVKSVETSKSRIRK